MQTETHTRPNQSALILAYMQRGQRIDAMRALSMFRCFRLAARIGELREAGHDIKTDMVDNQNGGRHAEYWMDNGNPGPVWRRVESEQ
jgi:hypothetical protein